MPKHNRKRTPESTIAGRATLWWPARKDSSVAVNSQICTISRIITNNMAASIATRLRSRTIGGSSVFKTHLHPLCRRQSTHRRAAQEGPLATVEEEGLA